MQSVSSNAVADVVSMSRTEHQIGYWQRRPMFEIMISASVPSYSGVNTLVSIPLEVDGVVTVVEFSGVYIKGTFANPSFVMNIPYTFIDASSGLNLSIYPYYNKSNNMFYITLGGNYSAGYYGDGEIYLTVKYIKQTTPVN